MRGSGVLALLAFTLAFALAFFVSPQLLEHKAEEPLVVLLDNGLTVIIKEASSAPIVAIDVWVATGSINENDVNNGISHFFEHMLFKGTEKRGVGEIDRAIDALGARNNAATGKDFTHYFIITPSESFEEVLEIQADAIMNSAFDPGEIEKERLVILEEKRRSLDNPRSLLFDALYELSYSKHPYRRPILGTMESISGITRADFLEYHKKHYTPSNMAVIIVGDVKAKEALERVKAAFKFEGPGTLPAQGEIEAPKGVKRRVIEKKVNQAYMGMAFHGPSIREEDNYVMDVIATLLGEGGSSRLNREIKEEKQLVNSIEAFFFSQKDDGLFFVTAAMKEENLERVEEEVLKALAKLKSDAPSEAELEKAKTQLVTQYAFNSETNIQQAQNFGYYYAVAGDYSLALKYPDNIRQVTREDVKRVAKEYFGEDYSIAIVKPMHQGGEG
jgi:zinc protease